MAQEGITPGEWFLGEEQTDPGEYGWDGRVWAAPLPEEVAAAEASRGTPMEHDAEAEEVATFGRLADARLFLAAPAMLASLKAARQFIANGIELGYIALPQPGTAESKTLPSIEEAIEQAEGGA